MTKKFKNLISKSPFAVFALILIFAFFTWKSTVAIDPDFGYRLRNGLEIPSKGVPRIDPYSYTMPTFPYVEHAWLTAVGMAAIYSSFGKLALSFTASLLVILSLLISVSRARLKNPITLSYTRRYWHFGNIFFILGVATFFNFVGIRVQVVSWLLVSVFLYVMFDEKLWRRVRKFTPFLFLLWTNLHGSFAAGLSIFLLVVVLRSVRLRKVNRSDLILFFASVLTTFVNPYGIGVWREVWSSVSDSSLRWRVSEWMPAIFVTDLTFASYLAISTTIVWKFRKKYKLEEVGLYFFVLIQALMSARHIPIWVLVSLPTASAGIGHLYSEVKGIKFAIPRFKRVYSFALFGSLFILAYAAFFAAKDTPGLSEEHFYPKKAVVYLKQNQFEGNLFSEYGWGGYLIWKYPEQKLFIDGRMPSWKRSDYPESETESAFDDYVDILTGEEDYQKFFDKYDVDVVLWPTDEETVYDLVGNKLDDFLEKLGKSKDDFDLITELEEDGWEKMYEDEVSAIYVLNK